MQPEIERPGAGGAATGPGMSKRALGHFPLTATVPAEQRLPVLIARHIGRDYLAALAASGAR
jgi:hypothetical protein